MRKIFGSRLAGLYQSLPTVVAELSEELSYRDHGHTTTHDRGSRAYLILSRPNPLDSETVDCLVRNKMNQFRLREISWKSLRFPEIAIVPATIGERCWRGTKDEMTELVRQISLSKTAKIDNFAPDVDL
jgi:hypothetical protein